MYPVIFEFGPITLHSFGLMMGIAFIVANYFFSREIQRRGMPEELSSTVTLIALIGGVVGAKLFSLLENWNTFTEDPLKEIFSTSGLTFYGGLLVAIAAIYMYLRRKRVRFLRVADAAAASLIIAYGIGRLGCQLAGDGDYGIPSDLPWAMTYPEGTVPTLSAGPRANESLVAKFEQMYPGRQVPADIPVHPAPVYEALASLAIFGYLWSIRKKPMPTGKLFAIYLVLAGIERLLVEFIRLNDLYLGLSQAQWISTGMIIVGGYMILRSRSQPPDLIPERPAPRRSAVGSVRAAR